MNSYEKYIQKLKEMLESADKTIGILETELDAYKEICSLLTEKNELLEKENRILKQRADTLKLISDKNI